MDRPLISVLLAVYNVEKYIHQCIDSILCQTYENLEIIIVDDGSTDKSGEICDAYKAADSRVRVIHQENQGLSGARNTGIENASGAFISFLDADDYIDPDFIEYLFHVLSSTNSDIAYCEFRRVSEDGRLLSTPKDHRDSHIETFSKNEALINCLRARKGFQMFVWNGLFKKSILSRFTPGRRIGQDQDFTIRTLANADRVAKGWGVHHSYRIRKGGSKSLELTKRMNFQYLALKDIKSAIENLPADKELMDAYYERCFRMDLGLIDRYSTGLLKDKDLFLTLRTKMREDSRKAYPDIRGMLLSFVLGANESCYRIAFKIIKRFQK